MRDYEMEVLADQRCILLRYKRRDDASERDKDFGEARPFIVSYFKPIRKAGISGGHTCVQ